MEEKIVEVKKNVLFLFSLYLISKILPKRSDRFHRKKVVGGVDDVNVSVFLLLREIEKREKKKKKKKKKDY